MQQARIPFQAKIAQGLLAALYLVLLAACATAATPPPSDEIVAIINNAPVTLAQLEREFAFDRAVYKLRNDKDLVLKDLQGTLQDTIPTLLLDQQAVAAGFTATETEITDQLNAFAEARNFTPADLDAELQRYGHSLTDFRAYIARSIRIEKYLTQVFSNPELENVSYGEWLAGQRAHANIEILYRPPAGSPLQGSPAPDFLLTNLKGESTNLTQYRGRPVILNFWATWCGPCRTEMPLLQAAFEQHRAEGLVVLAVNFEEEAALVKPFIEELGLTFEVLYDMQAEAGKTYQVTGLPTTFFIDRQGVIQRVKLGEMDEEFLAAVLPAIL